MTLLTFRFRHSRSDDLPWLIELAKRGRFMQQALSPRQIVYETSFDVLDPLQLSHALSLSTALVHTKKAEVFVASQTLRLPMVREVLRCYQQSQQIEDPHAFCWFRTSFSTDPHPAVVMLTLDAPARVLFPCKLAANQAHGIHPVQVGAIEDQVDAALLRAGTRWCPRLADLMEWQRAAGLLTLRAL